MSLQLVSFRKAINLPYLSVTVCVTLHLKKTQNEDSLLERILRVVSIILLIFCTILLHTISGSKVVPRTEPAFFTTRNGFLSVSGDDQTTAELSEYFCR